VNLGQLKAMSAIEHCRSAALGGHVERCEDCGHGRIAYNSCRNRPPPVFPMPEKVAVSRLIQEYPDAYCPASGAARTSVRGAGYATNNEAGMRHDEGKATSFMQEPIDSSSRGTRRG
jgi:hypothetical protein